MLFQRVAMLASRVSHPVDATTVRIQPAFPDLWTDVGVGTISEVCEGSRVVGEATVIELFPSI